MTNSQAPQPAHELTDNEIVDVLSALEPPGETWKGPREHNIAFARAVIAADRAARQSPAVTHAARDVLAERQRQISAEGWTPEHDDEHADGSMALAAGCYALHHDDTGLKGAPAWWPWHAGWWKPADPRRNLVKAGALILAEIERLDRASDVPVQGSER